MRHQSVDEFWTDLEAVRRIAGENETSTEVRSKFHTQPQPHVARGYTPIAPVRARFDTSRDLKLRNPFGPAAAAGRSDIDKYRCRATL